ncbi:transposase family protein [Actinomyces sp.]|uniref:transposase family protein n=1 Tax=Actinomyces sp. TaxID=29317 RepID=UPI0026DA74C2|nr:transposase family protein [Actinomyces sp.]MDO4900994.1 transposase family protein [Actinomyces sp.]
MCAVLHSQGDLPVAGSRVLGLYQRVKLTVMALRHNISQELLAEIFDISQPTASRIIGAYTTLIAHALGRAVATVEDLDPTQTLIIDGTVLECWDWKGVPGLFSGKCRTTGLNVQVACTPSGAIAWVSDPLLGATHDAAALRASGLLDVPPDHLPDGATAALHIGDKGYIGLGMTTPIKKLPGQPLHETDKAYNTAVNPIHPLHGRTGHRQPQNLARPTHRLPPTHTNLPNNHHHRTRPHLHIHPMNNPPVVVVCCDRSLVFEAVLS